MDGLLLAPAPAPAPASLSECVADTSGNPYEALAWKIGGLFGILATSCIGVALPYTMQGERHRNTIFLFRAFAAGVVLSVAFVHILPDALETFANPCLVMPADIPWASIIAVASALLSFVAEFYVREGLKSQFKSSKAAAAAKAEQSCPGALDCQDCAAECAECTVDCTAECTTGVAGADCQECQTAALDCQECQAGSSAPTSPPQAAAATAAAAAAGPAAVGGSAQAPYAEKAAGIQGPLAAPVAHQIQAVAGASLPQPQLTFPVVTSGMATRATMPAGPVAAGSVPAGTVGMGSAAPGVVSLPAGVVMSPVAPSQKLSPPCPSDCADCAVQMVCCMGPQKGNGVFGKGSGEVTGSGAEEEAVLSSRAIGGEGQEGVVSPEQLQVFRATAITLEAGIIFHSIFIGIALGTSREVTGLQGLTIALLFHQGFEGIALGGAFLKARLPILKVIVMGLAFALTCPVGVAIGLGVANTYNPNSSTALAVEGSFNAVSAGILIYNGLVDLLLPTFDQKDYETPKNAAVVACGFLVTFIGAGAMSTLALWA